MASLTQSWPAGAGIPEIVLTGINLGTYRDGVLDPRFWDFSPKSVRVGHGGLLPSVEAGMVGCRQNDSTFLFVTSDLSYGSDRVGLIEPDSPVVWYLKINKVVKNR